jgi:hypothetical protein
MKTDTIETTTQNITFDRSTLITSFQSDICFVSIKPNADLGGLDARY